MIKSPSGGQGKPCPYNNELQEISPIHRMQYAVDSVTSAPLRRFFLKVGILNMPNRSANGYM